MIFQGSTPTHTFNIPLDVSLLAKVLVTYGQNDVELFSKTKDDCDCAGKVIKVTLTQEETLMFNPSHPVQIQVRVLTTGGDSIPSKIKTVSAYRAINGDVL